ncbi:MAG: hypothetical protein HYZ53_22405 [Planctomycetes bacterium]|nr:hypothetical protein [Planctomycetota bacterium]
MTRRSTRRDPAPALTPAVLAAAAAAFAAVLACGAASAHAGDLADKAAAYDILLAARHLPHDTVLDARMDSPTGDHVLHYAHFEDSAIWTGHYLASQAYRFAATGSADALANARRALAGITRLLDVAGGQGYLARAAVPVASPWAADLVGAHPVITLPAPANPRVHPPEAGHTFYKSVLHGVEWYWEGTISRDQYSGVMFGLALAWDLIPQEDVRTAIRHDVTRIATFLEARGWTPVAPDGEIPTTFLHRPEQILAFLQIARHVNPSAFASVYERRARQFAPVVWTAIFAETLDVYESYFKFNLDHINLFNLIRLETGPNRRARYARALSQWLRPPLAQHKNVFFDYVYEAALGRHDAAILDFDRAALELFPAAPRRNHAVTNSSDPSIAHDPQHPDHAAHPLPVDRRPPNPFLWQKHPGVLDGGGDGTRELPGIDFLLPYWMGRYHGFLPASA